MSKLTDSFRTVGVFNPYAFHGDEPYIEYRPNGDSRSMIYAAWGIHAKGRKLSDHWRDNGVKFVHVNFALGATFADRKATALAAAQKWASERFGITEWARSPYGSYGEAGHVKARVAELKAEVERVSEAS